MFRAATLNSSSHLVRETKNPKTMRQVAGSHWVHRHSAITTRFLSTDKRRLKFQPYTGKSSVLGSSTPNGSKGRFVVLAGFSDKAMRERLSSMARRSCSYAVHAMAMPTARPSSTTAKRSTTKPRCCLQTTSCKLSKENPCANSWTLAVDVSEKEIA